MLSYDPSKRISASEALKHPFITKNTNVPVVLATEFHRSLSNLRNFHTQTLFEKAVLTYIASQQMQQQDEAKIRKIFDGFDLDKDGQLSKDEIVAGYTKFYNDPKKAKTHMEQIMKNIDMNHNGKIDYNGKS